MLYESEAWCLKENEKAILRRTERAMVKAMCGQKVVDRKTTEEQMDMLGLKKTIDRSATANAVRWYEHELILGLQAFRQTGQPRRLDCLAPSPVCLMKMEASCLVSCPRTQQTSLPARSPHYPYVLSAKCFAGFSGS